MFEIINTSNEADVQNEFVAIGAIIDRDGEAKHTVLIFTHESRNFAFHYTGSQQNPIQFTEIIGEHRCFHKITSTINPILIPSFIVMCQQIQKKANPKYGYFYSGEYYTSDGKHFSEAVTGEFMTCAGFAIKILKGFLGREYVMYTDWGNPTTLDENYITDFAEKTGIEISELLHDHRRISPIELLCSAYFNELPIRKNQIDSKVDEVSEFLGYHKLN